MYIAIQMILFESSPGPQVLDLSEQTSGRHTRSLVMLEAELKSGNFPCEVIDHLLQLVKNTIKITRYTNNLTCKTIKIVEIQY